MDCKPRNVGGAEIQPRAQRGRRISNIFDTNTTEGGSRLDDRPLSWLNPRPFRKSQKSCLSVLFSPAIRAVFAPMAIASAWRPAEAKKYSRIAADVVVGA